MNIIDKLRIKSLNPTAEAPVKIAFLGDSVTHGCFEIIDKGEGRIDCVYDHEAVYHNRLKQKIETVFPNCPVTVINAGISGGTAPHGAERLQRDVIDANPDLVVVCFGLNDALQGAGIEVYLNGLKSIFSKLNEAGIECIFMTPNMMSTYVCPQLTSEWLKNTGLACCEVQNSGKMDEYVFAAIHVCQEMNITVCDCYKDWKQLHNMNADITFLLSNYINHPSRSMHYLFAERLFETIVLKDIQK